MLKVSWFLCGLLYFFAYNYLFCKMVCKTNICINKKCIIMNIISAVLFFLIQYFNFGVFRPFITMFIFFIIFKIYYNIGFSKTLIGVFSVFSVFLLFCISELLYGIILSFFLSIDIDKIMQNAWVYMLSNIIILINSIIFSKMAHVYKLLNHIISWYKESEFKRLIIFSFLGLVVITYILYNNFVNVLPLSILAFTNIFCIGVFVFVIGFFFEKSNNNKIAIEYDQLLSYVKVYENEIEEKSKNQHEYNNQLIIVKNLISPKNKKAIRYINKQLNAETESEDRSWLAKLKYVPQGGLKGLIYYKIQEMLKNNITIFVDISPQLQEVNNNENINKYLEDISKVIGVYLDNAIQAVNELPEKYIILEFYLEDNYIVFSLSNNYRNKINFDEVDIEGYTTKGYGHGYGLSLVKDILSKSDILTQKREMNGIYYVEKLYIKK